MIPQKPYKGNRRLLQKLYKRHNGNCAVCGKTCLDTKYCHDGRQLPNHSTIGHVYIWLDLRRHAKGGNKVRLECQECNLAHSRKFEKSLYSFYNSMMPHPKTEIKLMELYYNNDPLKLENLKLKEELEKANAALDGFKKGYNTLSKKYQEVKKQNIILTQRNIALDLENKRIFDNIDTLKYYLDLIIMWNDELQEIYDDQGELAKHALTQIKIK